MLTRLASLAIVIFWMVMTYLLVRNEVAPDLSSVREVPLAHVLKMLFMHEQPSDMTLYSGTNVVGSVRLQPHLDRESGARVLDLSGDLRLQLTPGEKTRFSWMTLLELSPSYQIARSRWSLTMIEPEYLRIELDTPKDAKAAHYVLRNRIGITGEGDLPVGQGGLASLSGLAASAGAGTDLSAFIPHNLKQSPPEVKALQSSLKIHGDRTETFLITIEQNGQTLLEAHLSQLGQVLMAKTLIGYTLRLDGLTP
jgi:hypothetical protein